jgi:(S)-sulfolactate dehydrogenase
MAAIVVTEFMDETAVARMTARWPTLYAADLVDRPDDLRAALADARALIVRNRTQVDAALLAHAPHLRQVGRLGVGLDNIALDACAARDVQVHPATGANDDAVAEYVVCATMILLRPAFLMSSQVGAGAWPRDRAIGREIAGAQVGLVGLGRTAQKTARLLAALGMHVAAFDPMLPGDHPAWQDVERLDLATLLGRADVVSLHVPLTSHTRHFIDAAALTLMRHGAVLINAARGGVVDEAAVAAALIAGRLGGAALDVFEQEPLRTEAAKFHGVPNLLLTPHIAGVTEESNVRVSALIATVILQALEVA